MENKIEKEEVVSQEEQVVENNELEQVEEQKPKKKKKKRKISRIIINTITFILFLVIVFDVVIGVVNMQRISNKEEPVWYLSTKTTETELKTVTEYHLGLYKIVKTDTAKETKTTLKPFFLSE